MSSNEPGPWLSRTKLLVGSLIFLAVLVYLGLIRSRLMPSMATVPVELVGYGAVAAAFALSLLALLFQLLRLAVLRLLVVQSDRSSAWHAVKRQGAVSLVLGALLLLLAALSQQLAYTPPITREDGSPIAGSIASLEEVELNGSRQWITIRGNSVDNPILLFLAGGPGGSQLAAVRSELKGLEEHFTVVGWDQPGSAKSFHAVPAANLTPERYVSDGCALAAYLAKRFGQDKIYLVGESWGSALGIWMVQEQPELFHAFAGTGQMVSFLDTEHYCYDLALQTAGERGDEDLIRKLEGQGPPPYYGEGVAWKMSNYLMYLFGVMSSDPAIAGSDHNTFADLAAPEYGLYDKINYVRGLLATLNQVYPKLYDLDLRQQAAELKVPVFFLEGRHDINAPPALAVEYHGLLTAPAKELIWFEHSGHTPWVDENERFIDVMVERVLAKPRIP